MKHEEYRRIVKGGETAVLFIHGIAGTPNHFLPFLPLVPDGFSVCNLLLDGHGKGVRDFSRTSMAAWENQVQRSVEELAATHSRIFIAAHSMGTLFAIEQAIREPRITGIFLLAAPLRLFIRPQLAVNSAKVFLDWIRPDDAVALAARDCYGIAWDKNVLHYVGWIPRYLELFQKIREVRQLLPELGTSGYVFQSAKDEMLSLKALRELRQSSWLSVSVLPDSGHYYYAPADKVILLERFREFLS